MNNKKTLMVISLALVLLIGGASVLYTRLGSSLSMDQLAVQQTQQTGTAAETADQETADQGAADQEAAGPEPALAPDFTVYDREGNEVQLSDYTGKPIVLNFWASWCGPCQMEMPDFHEKYLELGQDVHFLMVNMTDGSRETVDSASAFIDKNAYGFPVFYDTAVDAARTYGVYSLPTTYFINAKGQAIAQATGTINAETLQRGIDMIM